MTTENWGDTIAAPNDKFPDTGTKRNAPGRHHLLGLSNNEQQTFLMRNCELSLSEGIEFAKNHPFEIARRLANAIKPTSTSFDAFRGMLPSELSAIAKAILPKIEEIKKKASEEKWSDFTQSDIANVEMFAKLNI